MQTNPAVEQNKTLNGPLVREISPVGKEVYGGNDLVEERRRRGSALGYNSIRPQCMLTVANMVAVTPKVR